MDMKQVIQKIVSENQDVFEEILYFAERKSWIFISEGLNERLKKEYKHYPYRCANPEGNIFQIKKETGKWDMHVDKGWGWNEVSLLKKANAKFGEGPSYLASDPEMVVFLS